ncbi:hypothetical protein JCM6882_003600 [Rhodosporidiobolus microsporus]
MSSPHPPSSTPSGTVPYHEPSFAQLAVLLSLFYLLQLARGGANALLGAGLLGEIAVGVVFGPCAKILGEQTEREFIAVGYIGLVLIVFEGGLTLNARSFLSQLPLALLVALVGILLPMAFSFALFSAPTYGYPTLQAFTAGSALASTSLGTTFFVLRSAGPALSTSRVGEILKGAALIDDVIALVLLSVIQSLGPDPSSVTGLGWTIGRPVVASVAMALVAPVLSVYVFRPLFRTRRVEGAVAKGGMATELFLGVAALTAFLAIAYYAGTTMLLGAFLAGLFLRVLPSTNSAVSFVQTWETWILPLHEHIFVPLFFASIGFSIPFLSLWTGARIWRGIVYAILMTLAKVLAGTPILLIDLFSPFDRLMARSGAKSHRGEEEEKDGMQTPLGRGGERGQLEDGFVSRRPPLTEAERASPSFNLSGATTPTDNGQAARLTRSSYMLNESLPAACFLGFALVARGEIGVLILQVAYTSAAEASDPSASVLSEEPYLLGIWAVALCTIVGPVAFGAVTRRCGDRVVRGRWGAV